MAFQGVNVERVVPFVLVLVGGVGVGSRVGLAGGGGGRLRRLVGGGLRESGVSDRGDLGSLAAEVVGEEEGGKDAADDGGEEGYGDGGEP